MGTIVSFHIRAGTAGAANAFLALAEARAELHRADAVFSTWKEDSPMSRIRRGELAVADAPRDVTVVLDRCRLALDISGGWFDPWAAPGGVDPTGLVKGWAAARAMDALARAGVAAAMVSAGGDVAVLGEPQAGRPWRIGVQNPFDRGTVVAVVQPQGAIATSGCYERGRHLYDPFTGEAAAAVASATVTGPDLDLADALATALAVGGERALPWVEGQAGYEALLIRHDGSTLRTDGLPEAADAAAVAPAGPPS